MNSNPLIADTTDYSVKKKWWEETVFRNQAKELPKKDKSFINDSTRNNFHRKFLEKYIH
jgi:protein CWC15